MLRSAISRLAYSISLARHGYATPLVSMHMPYSPSALKMGKKSKLGMKAGRGGKGRAIRRRGGLRGRGLVEREIRQPPLYSKSGGLSWEVERV